ncbi:MAG: hypothetical protein RMK63_10790 [Thermus sp.]|nr:MULTISPECIES: hypothetical protein [Thermus]MDW8358383.1 hypothetical protein [Thermus sp.]
MVLDLKVQMGFARVPGIPTLPNDLPPQHPIPRTYLHAPPAQVSEKAVLVIRMAYQHVITKNAPGKRVKYSWPWAIVVAVLDGHHNPICRCQHRSPEGIVILKSPPVVAIGFPTFIGDEEIVGVALAYEMPGVGSRRVWPTVADPPHPLERKGVANLLPVRFWGGWAEAVAGSDCEFTDKLEEARCKHRWGDEAQRQAYQAYSRAGIPPL